MAVNGHNPLYRYGLHSAADWHISYVYSDPEFVEAVELLNEAKTNGAATEDVAKVVRGIADHFAVSVADVNLFMLPLYIESRQKPTAMSFDPQTKRFSISFELTTTRAELLDEWQRFEQLRDTLMPQKLPKSKRKPPEYPGLIYAVFKALKEHTDKEVFDMYRKGKLSGYAGSTTQFSTYAELMHYYSKHKPTITQDV